MRRGTITLPTDLEAEVEEFLSSLDPRPSLTALVQSALRHEREYIPASRRFEPFIAERGSGRSDVSR